MIACQTSAGATSVTDANTPAAAPAAPSSIDADERTASGPPSVCARVTIAGSGSACAIRSAASASR
ncbi:MAG: hypothetical protein WKG01_36050 [Kofleriaceae bacterium]